MKKLVATFILMTVGTAGAGALPVKFRQQEKTPAQVVTNPEIQAAEQRVNQAKAQLEIATKQLSAAKALLKAAQADLRASQTSLDALNLQAHAQGLVNETGMTPAKAPPVKLAVKDEKAEAAAADTAPAAAPEPGADTRIRTDAADSGNEEAPTIQLR